MWVYILSFLGQFLILPQYIEKLTINLVEGTPESIKIVKKKYFTNKSDEAYKEY
jgi:hypothetical protein